MAKPKTQSVHITTHEDGTATIFLDGKDISSRVKWVDVHAELGKPPRLILEYICYEQNTIDGEMVVVHVCPKGARAKSGPDWASTS